MSKEFINVPIPAEHVTKVFEFVAGLDSEVRGDHQSPREQPMVLTEYLVTRMYRESEDAHRRLLEFLASHPDEWLDSQEVADGLGLQFGRKSLAGSLGAFGRRADHRYGGQKPFESHWDDGDYLVKLRMSQEVAAWIEAAAAS
jgi:hypothetical protein